MGFLDTLGSLFGIADNSESDALKADKAQTASDKTLTNTTADTSIYQGPGDYSNSYNPATFQSSYQAPTGAATGYNQVTSGQVLSDASDLASASSGGAVSSAAAAAKGAGLSGAEAAMLGAQTGANTYSSALQNAYTSVSTNDLGEQEQNLQNMGLTNQYNLSVSNMSLENQKQFNDFSQTNEAQNLTHDQQLNQFNVDKAAQTLSEQGQVNTFNLGFDQAENQKYATDMSQTLAQLGIDQENKKLAADSLGKALSGVGNILSGGTLGTATSLLSGKKQHGQDAYEKGRDVGISEGESSLVGEVGPEIVKVAPEHSIVPNIKTGYEMLDEVCAAIRDGKRPDKNSSINSGNSQVAAMSMIAAMNDKLDRALREILR